MPRPRPNAESPPKTPYRVLDRAALARRVRAFVERAGGQVKAAKELKGVGKFSQGTVSKLCNGELERLSGGTFARLASALPEAAREELRRSVLSPDQVTRLRQCDGWLGHELQGYTTAPHPGAPEPMELSDPEVYGSFRVRRQYRLLDEPVYPAVERLRGDRRYAGYFNGLEKTADKRWGKDAPEREWRLALAEYRVVEPLLRGRVSGGVERVLAELEASGVLASYLSAACRAQRILLERPSAYERAFQHSRRQRQRRRTP